MKLTRTDWVDAAFKAMSRGGPAAIAVARLADELGATRGSFYHYFGDRQELLVAALEKWEHDATDAFIDRASSETAPATQLRNLFAQVFREPTELAAIERHLLAGRAESSAVATVVDRVVDRRKAYLADCYEAMGYEPAHARDQATVVYMMFTGWLFIDPDLGGSPEESPSDLASAIEELLLSET